MSTVVALRVVNLVSFLTLTICCLSVPLFPSGEVFKGSARGVPVAIKTMIVVDEANVLSFKKEIMLTAKLHHPNIVGFVGACWSQQLTCLILEWVEKGSLADLLEDVTVDLFWNEALLRLATQIAQGMAYLNENSILHRDLKPDNVLVTSFMSAKITDFGTSRAKGLPDVTMSAVGTPLFCAPEMMRGECYDESADVYSFGLTLIAMCVEESLLDFLNERFKVSFSKKKAPTTMRLIRKMTEDGWRAVGYDDSLITFAPMSINSLIIRCTAHEPSERPSFKTIVQELENDVKREVEGVQTEEARFSRKRSDSVGQQNSVVEDEAPTPLTKAKSFGRSADPAQPRKSQMLKRGSYFPTALQPAKLEQIRGAVRKSVRSSNFDKRKSTQPPNGQQDEETGSSRPTLSRPTLSMVGAGFEDGFDAAASAAALTTQSLVRPLSSIEFGFKLPGMGIGFDFNENEEGENEDEDEKKHKKNGRGTEI